MSDEFKDFASAPAPTLTLDPFQSEKSDNQLQAAQTVKAVVEEPKKAGI